MMRLCDHFLTEGGVHYLKPKTPSEKLSVGPFYRSFDLLPPLPKQANMWNPRSGLPKPPPGEPSNTAILKTVGRMVQYIQ